MGIADRIESTVERWRGLWGEALSNFLMKSLERGATALMESLEPAAQDQVRDSLTTIKDNPDTPDPIRTLIDTILAPGHPVPLLVVIPLAILLLLPMVLGLSQPLSRLIMYPQDKLMHSFRLDPISVITAWRRDKEKYEDLFDDLRDLGWDDKRIEALKFYSLYYPAPADLVHWQAREVFEPHMVERYGLDAELGEIEREPFYKAGMTDEQIQNYWRAHWEHASWMQVVEMLRRNQLTEDELRDWFRLVEIPPFWRDKLIAISWEVPTRVDVRRWWDMRTIDEARLREIYRAQGYHDKDLEDYVLWTKVYVAFPDLVARWNNGWLTEDEVRSELTGLGMPTDRVDEMIQTKIKTTQGERTSSERDITKTDIIKGVKTAVITRGEGIELLTDMGYDEDEADYILEINIPPDQEAPVIKERELTKTDILNGLKAGVITEAEAQARLVELRYNPADAEFLLRIFAALVTPPVEPRDREASKADIVQAVKKGLITPEDGYLMLQDIGFSPEAAQFILTVRAETSPFSPASFAEFKDRSHKLRLATGLESKPMTDELKRASEAMIRLTGEVHRIREAVEAEESRLVDLETLPLEAEAKRTELQISLRQAEAELSRVKADYDRLLAAWRHRPSP